MSWRTVVISSRCKLDMKMGYMVVRGEQTRRIFLDEIAVVNNGSLMLQGSVYCKLLLNSTAQSAMSEIIRRGKPPAGVVRMLTVTEKQFARMEYIVRSYTGDVIDSDERMIEL